MATTTATLTLSSSDLTGDSLALSTTATLTKAGVLTGLDQTTGVARKFYAAEQTDTKLIDKADFTDAKAHKVYIKNISATASESVMIQLNDGVATVELGLLYAGDWCFLPYDGTADIEIDTSAVNMTVEYLVIYEA